MKFRRKYPVITYQKFICHDSFLLNLLDFKAPVDTQAFFHFLPKKTDHEKASFSIRWIADYGNLC
jgi:hypothetical protein